VLEWSHRHYGHIWGDSVSLLIVWRDERPESPLLETADLAEITAALRDAGCGFERRELSAGLSPDAAQDEVLALYQDLVAAEVAARGFRKVDVAGIVLSDDPGYPAQAAKVRATFINEHTHGDDDEVRFIIRGAGAFYLHIAGHVHAILAEAGDLTRVPQGTTHWFDAGSQPDFTAIRFFHDPQGWVGVPTGSDINERFPDYDRLRARYDSRPATAGSSGA
jgi:1,2-dihydroxy-3-keto-5-methylthiopentene dioxygenase